MTPRGAETLRPPRADVETPATVAGLVSACLARAVQTRDEYLVRCLLNRFVLLDDACRREHRGRYHLWADDRDKVRRRVAHYAATGIYIGEATQ